MSSELIANLRLISLDSLKQDLKAAQKATQKTLMPEHAPGEGDLFDLGAMEEGFC